MNLVTIGTVTPSKKKTGLIGVGKWGSILKEKLDKISDLKFSLNSKQNYKRKIENIDWVFIATPDKTHYEIVKNCLNSNVNVFCEKPLTNSEKESEHLFRIAEKQKVKLYVDDIQNYLNANIVYKKKNYITRRKKSEGNSIDLLYRLAYHDIYFIYPIIKNEKIKKINIRNIDDNLNFDIVFENFEFNFFYDLNSDTKIHNINNYDLITKKDVLLLMIKRVLNNQVNFDENKNLSLFANRIIDMIQNKVNVKL